MARKEVSRVEKVLNVWGVSLIVWSVYRFYFKTDLPLWFDEFIAKPLVFVLPAYYYITKHEKENFLVAVSLKVKKLGKEVLFGLIVGLALFTLIVITSLKNIDLNQRLLYLFIVALATSFSEEILSRGFVLKRLYEESKNIWAATFFASILFFFLHVPILFSTPNIGGDILIRIMTTDLVLSFALSFLFILRGSLVVPILVHAFYALSLFLLI